MIYTNGTEAVCVASKCGSNTLSCAGPAHGWWELLDARDLVSVQCVHCVVRQPLLRMLSAWRMYFVLPVVVWQNTGDWHKVYGHLNADRALPWAKIHRADIWVRPVQTFHRFLREELPYWLEREDPHFMSQWHTYRGLSTYTAVRYHRDFTQLQLELGWTPQHQHRGIWPWQYVEEADFVIAAPQLPHLEDDWRIYDK